MTCKYLGQLAIRTIVLGPRYLKLVQQAVFRENWEEVGMYA